MMEASSSFVTSVLTRVTRRNIPGDATLHSYRRENLKSYIHFNIIHPPTFWSCYWFSSFSLFHHYPIYMHFCAPIRATFPSHTILLHLIILLLPYYRRRFQSPFTPVSPACLYLHPYSVQALPLAPSASVSPLMWDTKCRTHAQQT
jgi:hypothetical protein